MDSMVEPENPRSKINGWLGRMGLNFAARASAAINHLLPETGYYAPKDQFQNTFFL